MSILLIGIDDTDNDTSPGTGRLARNLAEECRDRGWLVHGITRHQFLQDSNIPYTSHNSGACISLEHVEGNIDGLWSVFDYVAQHAAVGSDPGVCIAYQNDVANKIQQFGIDAMTRVLCIPEAFELIRNTGIRLHGLGGNCQGVIGAIGSVGQRVEGNYGRFIDLPGLRKIKGCVTRSTLDKMAFAIQHEEKDRLPQEDDRYDTQDWVRPRLVGGEAVWPVKWSERYNAWISLDRKKQEPSSKTGKL